MVLTSEEKKNLRLLPTIRRARDYHLYDPSGRRILDLYLDGGRAWLGHRPEGVSLQLKNSLSRGVYAPYPSTEEAKMLKAAKALALTVAAAEAVDPAAGAVFGGKLKAAYYAPGSKAPEDAGLGEAHDPLMQMGDEGERFQLWRPGLFWPSEAEVIEILIPLPGIDTGRILVSIAELPEGDLPSAVLASAVSRTLWSLITMLEKEFAMAASTVHYRKPRTYSVPETQDFTEVLPGRWKKVSCYYLWDGNAEDYNELFRKALEAGVLLPPSPAYPCIIPGELTSGDLAALKKIL